MKSFHKFNKKQVTNPQQKNRERTSQVTERKQKWLLNICKNGQSKDVEKQLLSCTTGRSAIWFNSTQREIWKKKICECKYSLSHQFTFWDSSKRYTHKHVN